MLQKCANPTCVVPFLSLREGKLFLAETFPSNLNATFDGSRRKLRRREHFWLCDACSSHYTLRFDAAQGMLTVPLSRAQAHRFGAAQRALDGLCGRKDDCNDKFPDRETRALFGLRARHLSAQGMVPSGRQSMARPAQDSLLASFAGDAKRYEERVLPGSSEDADRALADAGQPAPAAVALCSARSSARSWHYPPMPIGSDPSLSDLDLGPDAMGRWSASWRFIASRFRGSGRISRGPGMHSGGTDHDRGRKQAHALECQLFTLPQQSPHGISLQ